MREAAAAQDAAAVHSPSSRVPLDDSGGEPGGQVAEPLPVDGRAGVAPGAQAASTSSVTSWPGPCANAGSRTVAIAPTLAQPVRPAIVTAGADSQ